MSLALTIWQTIVNRSSADLKKTPDPVRLACDEHLTLVLAYAMFGHLVPCSGGKSIDLARTNVYLGRRPDADREAPLGEQTALCRLRFVEGWWHVEDLLRRGDLRVNHERVHSCRLNRLDELAIGRARFRIDYVTPEDASVLSDALEEIAESVLFSQSNLGLLRSAPPANASPPVSVAAVRPERTPQSPPPPAVPSTSGISTTTDMLIAAPLLPSELLGRLVPLGGGADHPLMKPKILVGRQPPCDIVLRVGTISSKHCTLELTEGYWQVKDLGSRNGVRLDSVRCDQAWVFPESRLSIADQRFRLDYTPDGEPPVPNPAQRPSLMAQAGLVGEELERLMTKPSRPGNQDADSERKRFELLEDV